MHTPPPVKYASRAKVTFAAMMTAVFGFISAPIPAATAVVAGIGGGVLWSGEAGAKTKAKGKQEAGSTEIGGGGTIVAAVKKKAKAQEPSRAPRESR